MAIRGYQWGVGIFQHLFFTNNIVFMLILFSTYNMLLKGAKDRPLGNSMCYSFSVRYFSINLNVLSSVSNVVSEPLQGLIVIATSMSTSH